MFSMLKMSRDVNGTESFYSLSELVFKYFLSEGDTYQFRELRECISCFTLFVVSVRKLIHS